MTRVDFRDWLLAHGCEFIPLNELTTGNSVKVVNKKFGTYIYLDLPIDNRPVKDFYVCQSCSRLGIPIPNHTEHMNGLVEEIKKRHYPDK